MEGNEADDRFVKDSGQFDLTIVVDNHRIKVSKAVMCVASPVFRAMLDSDFKERNQSEIKLPVKKYEDFVQFLSCIYPDRLESVTGETVYAILPLASEYQVKKLEDRCQLCLIRIVTEKHVSDIFEVYRHLQLAELYKLDQLTAKCIFFASEFNLDDSVKAEASHHVSDEALVKIKNIVIKRFELDRVDDKFLFNKRYSDEEEYKSIIKEEIKKGSNILRAVRLCIRYFQDDTVLLGQTLKKLMDILEQKKKPATKVSSSYASPNEEEINLLPEKIKQRITRPHFDCFY